MLLRFILRKWSFKWNSWGTLGETFSTVIVLVSKKTAFQVDTFVYFEDGLEVAVFVGDTAEESACSCLVVPEEKASLRRWS